VELLRFLDETVRVDATDEPKWLASRLGALLWSGKRRRVVGTRAGIRLYLNPLSHLGQRILRRGVYKPDTYAIVRSRLRPVDVFVDVGGNEGVYSALGGKLVGERGVMVAVEPQVALRGIIEINCRLNDLVQRYVNTTGLCRPGEASEREQGRG
jgi:hypothetical protein